ncbi:MAG TPA: hypothetical protein VF260_04445 [Bacilli bacterium]
MWYQLLVFFHVLSVMLALGPFFLLIPLLRKMRVAQSEQLMPYISTFRLAVQFSRHGGHLLVLTGVLLIAFGPWTWKTSWVIVTVLIMFSSLYFFARAFSPILKALQEPGHDRKKLVAKLRNALYGYIFIMLLMMWIMKSKPVFW